MKSSQYNIFFPYNNLVVGYNSLENDYIFIQPELYKIYTKVLSEDISKLERIHPEFWDLLKSKNFIIPIDKDELEEVKKLVHSIDFNSEHYHLMINPTMDCNFRCWYCYETHMKGSKMEEQVIESIKKHIAKKLSSDTVKYLTISWFGGEPLLYFRQVVLPILEFANDYTTEKNISFNSNFTSNGFFINDKMLESWKKLKVDSIQITLDGHRDRHNKVRHSRGNRGSYDRIIDNIKKCLKSEIYVYCRINISKDTLSENIYEIINDFSDVPSSERDFLEFSFHQVWQERTNLRRDILNIIDKFNKNAFKTQYNMYNDTVRNSCYADKMNHATINYNGDVFKCTARDFKTENREGFLNENGDIEWNEKYKRRMNIKFKNEICLTCNILPICNGSCSQMALEKYGSEYCIHSFSEDIKIEIIKNKLEEIFN